MPEKKTFINPLRVGVTGGIGSGKSTVCRIFEALGIPVYDADHWAKWLVANDKELKTKMVDAFGSETYLADGTYNRSYIAGRVFSNKKELELLNALIHPAVAVHSNNWHEEQLQAGTPYTIKEAALMIESGSHHELDRLVVVTAPENLRIERVMKRDGVGKEAVLARLRNQLPESDKVKLADYIVENDENQLLLPQIWNIHKALYREAMGE